MGWGVYKQPDGKYAVWSSIVTDFVYYDATREEIRDLWKEEFGNSGMFNFEHLTMPIADGERRHPMGHTFEGLLRLRDEQHGLRCEKDGEPADKADKKARRWYLAWLQRMREEVAA